jgi:hypothetical protein
MKKNYPYKSDKPNRKYYIITNDNKKVYFGAVGYSDLTIHKDEARKLRYIKRHNNENWNKSGIDSAGFWVVMESTYYKCKLSRHLKRFNI